MLPISSIIVQLMNKTLPYLASASQLYPVGKYVYNNAYKGYNKIRNMFRKRIPAINQDNYTNAVQQLQGRDVDFASSLSQSNTMANLEKKESSNDTNDLKSLLENLNLGYNEANEKDYFRGNYNE